MMNIAYGTYETGRCNDFASQLELQHVSSNYPVLEIHVAGKDLKKLDVGSPSDPMVVMYSIQHGNWIEVDRTETISNNANPQFVKVFKALYIFELNQPLRFEVYDSDSSSARLKKHDFIGYIETDVRAISSSLDQELSLNLKHDTKSGPRGTIILKPQQSHESNTHLFCRAQVRNLKKVRTFCKDHPFVEFARPAESGGSVPVYRTEVKRRCYSCVFKQFHFILNNLSNGDLDNPMIVNVYHFRSRKAPQLIGSCEGSINSFLESVGTYHQLRNQKQQITGEICFNELDIREVPTFLDYLRGGLHVSLIPVIDFTGSNGLGPFSLHRIYKDPGTVNQYQACIMRVGAILSKYDSTQQYTPFGFGATFDDDLPTKSQMSTYCFPLTLDPEHDTVTGVQGILDAYEAALKKIDFGGPTHFAPILQKVMPIVRERFQRDHTYTILMIMTDGQIQDFYTTVDYIVNASDDPISIIIVGVGSAEFDEMERLDGDIRPLVTRDGRQTKRDIVQFVEFRKFKHASNTSLEQEVLAEIPTQVYQYCSTHGFNVNLHRQNQ